MHKYGSGWYKSAEARKAKNLYWKNRHRCLRNTVLEKLGGVCVKCGFSDTRALQIDHINGNGAAERRLLNHHTKAFLHAVLLDEGEKYQLLCANCNWIKRHEQQEWSKGRC